LKLAPTFASGNVGKTGAGQLKYLRRFVHLMERKTNIEELEKDQKIVLHRQQDSSG